MAQSTPSFSLIRVVSRASLASLAFIFTLSGTSSWLAVYPAYLINVAGLVIIGGIWLGWRLWKQRPFPSTRLDLPLIAWLAALLITSLTSIDPRQSMEKFVYFLAFTLIFYLMVDIRQSGKSLELWIFMLLTASSILIILGLMEFAAWYLAWLKIGGIEQPFPPATIRVGSTMGHPNLFAAYLNLILPLAAARFLNTSSRVRKFLLAILCLATLMLIYLTSSRGGWLGTATSLGLFTLLWSIDNRSFVNRVWKYLRGHPIIIVGMGILCLSAIGLIGWLLFQQSNHPSHSSRDPRGYIWVVAWDLFRTHPLFGTGPNTFGRAIMQTYSIPPGMLLLHAHNFLLNSLGESGILGIATTFWLALGIFLSAIQRWRVKTHNNRILLIGYLAALAGLAVHSQFEVPQNAPLVNLITAMLLAEIVSPFEYSCRLRQLTGKVLLIAGWITASMLGLWSLWGYSAFDHGFNAAMKEDWHSANMWTDKAVQRDPESAYYHFKSGIYHSRLALDDNFQLVNKAEMRIALEETYQGLRIESDFAPNWANLGELRWAGGDHAGGIEAMQQAVSIAPGSSELNLALGRMLEEIGETKHASDKYVIALGLQPFLAAKPFFQQSALRRDVITSFAPSYDEAGWEELEAGNYVLSGEIFRSRLGMNDSNAYLGLGLSLLGEERWDEAEQALRIAEFIDNSDVQIKEALITLYEMESQPSLSGSARIAAKNIRDWKDSHYSLSYYWIGFEMKEIYKRLAK